MTKWASAFNGSYNLDNPLVAASRRGFRARICERIERDNPEAARRVARTIYDGCELLGEFPNMGRTSIRMADRRELVFAPLPWLSVASH
jgi:plasmid stabilization system protein ParE